MVSGKRRRNSKKSVHMGSLFFPYFTQFALKTRFGALLIIRPEDELD